MREPQSSCIFIVCSEDWWWTACCIRLRQTMNLFFIYMVSAARKKLAIGRKKAKNTTLEAQSDYASSMRRAAMDELTDQVSLILIGVVDSESIKFNVTSNPRPRKKPPPPYEGVEGI